MRTPKSPRAEALPMLGYEPEATFVPAGAGVAFLKPGVLPLESLHATGAVHKLLLARKERMALGTDVQVQEVALESRARLESVTTRADHIDLMIVRVNLVLHKTPCLPPEQTPILTASSETFNSSFLGLARHHSLFCLP